VLRHRTGSGGGGDPARPHDSAAQLHAPRLPRPASQGSVGEMRYRHTTRRAVSVEPRHSADRSLARSLAAELLDPPATAAAGASRMQQQQQQ